MTQEAADLHAIASDVVRLVEGFDGYGCERNASGVRLKDQPAWVRFYLAVKEAERGKQS